MRPQFPRAVVVLSALALGVAPRLARADPPATRPGPLYVLSIWTEDADDQAEALTQALRWRVGQTAGFTLLQTNQSFETLAIALKCPPKPESVCLQRIGDQLKADHYIWGTMEKKKATPGEVNAEVHMWSRGKPDASTRESYADSLKDANDESLRAIASAILGKLTGIAPAPAPSPPPPAAPAAATAPSPASPSDNGPQTLGVGVTTPATAPSTEEADRFPTRSVLAYSALVVGGAMVVLSVVEVANWVNDNNKSSDDRKQVPSTVTDVCSEPVNLYAQDACNRSKDAVTSSTLAWVFGGVGLGLVGTGIVLMLTDHPTGPGDRSAGRARLMPSFGQHAGGVDLLVKF